MLTIEKFLTAPSIQSLGWALIHFIWQGALIALLTISINRMFTNRSANLRYLIACGALCLMVISPIVTFSLIDRSAIQSTINKQNLATSKTVNGMTPRDNEAISNDQINLTNNEMAAQSVYRARPLQYRLRS